MRAIRRSAHGLWSTRATFTLTLLSSVVRAHQMVIVVTVCLLGFSGSICIARERPDPQKEMALGQKSYDRGAFEEAIQHWQQAEALLKQAGDRRGEIEVDLRLAAAYEHLGRNPLAASRLQNALDLAQRLGDHGQYLRAAASLGIVDTAMGQTKDAETTYDHASSMAEADGDSQAAALILNNWGTLRLSQHRFAEAGSLFDRAFQDAQRASNTLLSAKALCNESLAAARAGETAKAGSLNREAVQLLQKTAASHDQASLLLVCGQTFQRLAKTEPQSRGRLGDAASNCFDQALEIATKIQDQRAASYALGMLGALAEDGARYDQALAYTGRAIFLAQQTPEALYRWEWQDGRILRAQGQIEPAIAAYKRAIQSLQYIRNDLFLAYANRADEGSFRETVGPVYYELADLLLRRTDTLSDPDQIQTNLVAARAVVEQLKSAELEDYFQDQCVNVAKKTPLEKVSPDAAVIYIIPLPDRTEILAGFATGLERFKAAVGSEELTAEVQRFRKNLEDRTTYEYLEQARHLYDWLIRPIKDELARRQIQTLVFVPDGALQTVPLAALQDGDRFLIQDFSVAMTPGLTLTAPGSARREGGQVLIAGLSQAVRGFPPLDYVPIELQHLRVLYPGEELFNKTFLDATLEKEFGEGQYSIVHIASHGQFEHDCNKTFLLTYDGKLTMDDLEHLIRPSQFRREPVELLTLSACQTAAGDDRAALGLAGVAVKAGARSALATLWFVNDQASATLMSEFYTQLAGDRSISKARALQLAQQKMLADRGYDHPCYWAPYLLIGNWL
jgi:CHAT domain-containing protein/Tfp pilus assembly protein PilF